jgi:undecaprenyl-diphosphatase
MAACLSTRFLLRFFQTRTLSPFAIYSVVTGVICIAVFA